ncbi:MAG: D-2-hydroxyacid dehydrogenase family protein, partial [Candidatus Binatia bacterium]
MQKMRVAILDDYQKVATSLADWSGLSGDVEIEIFQDHIDDEGAVSRRLKDFEIICIMRERTPFMRSLIERLPNLKLLVTSGMRNRSIDLAAAKERSVTVCGTPARGASTAELTWGLIIGLLRHIPEEDHATRLGAWQRTLGVGLSGKTLGIAGLGKLGSRVARVGLAFGMGVIAWSQNLTEERCKEVGVSLVTKKELLTRSDVLSIHLVLSDRTRGLIGAPELALMKPTAILVNTS